MTLPLLPVSPETARRLSGTPLVIMLDVDGTLAPIASRPEDAQVPVETRRVVAALAACEGVSVVLVSGRAAADARRMVSVANVWVIGNHGFEVSGPDGETVVDPQLEPYRALIARAARRLAPRVAPLPGVILEDKTWTLTVHYRLSDSAVVPRLREVIEEAVAPLGLRVTDGKKVFEVRPPARVDKGTAVILLGREIGALDEGSSLLFVGDDRTDEDAFRAIRRNKGSAVTARVRGDGGETTAAEFAVRDPAEVRSFLEWLLAARR
ncbi:MAG TPA: trehalose-phosphatase [Gemmatimonadaceae bacterium]|nr:trehalose-phosphatase [Gemmatimonadaceae bacterium]